MGKLLVYDQEAREGLQRGVNAFARAVKVTLGPKGRNVAFDKGWGAPTVTHDGATIAKEFGIEGALEALGSELLKQATTTTKKVAGDGTTTATVLAQALVNEGLRAVVAGANPVLLKQGIALGTAALVASIHAQSTPVAGKAAIARVATASSVQDQAIGELIGEVLDKVGKDGVITVEEAQGLQTEVKYVEGMRLDKGYLSPHFITDEERREAVLDHPAILATDFKLTSAADVLPMLEKLVAANKRELLIVAEAVEGEALAALIVNTLRGVVSTVAIGAPLYGDRRKEQLRDIALLTGGNYVSAEAGYRLADVDLEEFGLATRVISRAEETIIMGGEGSPEDIKRRIAEIDAEFAATNSNYDKEKLLLRKGRLTGSAAVLRAGAATQTELAEKKARLEDALASARSALEEGVVPGGGVAFLNAIPALDGVPAAGDVAIGVHLLRRALEEPVRQIAHNGGEDGSVVVAGIRARQAAAGNGNIGYNVMTDAYEDLLAAGVMDPTKVARTALEIAASVAQMILTTDALVTEKPNGTTASS